MAFNRLCASLTVPSCNFSRAGLRARLTVKSNKSVGQAFVAGNLGFSIQSIIKHYKRLSEIVNTSTVLPQS